MLMERLLPKNKENMLNKKINLDGTLKKMSISKKLFTSFVIILIISNIASILGLIFLQKTNSDYNNTLINYGFVQGVLESLEWKLKI